MSCQKSKSKSSILPKLPSSIDPGSAKSAETKREMLNRIITLQNGIRIHIQLGKDLRETIHQMWKGGQRSRSKLTNLPHIFQIPLKKVNVWIKASLLELCLYSYFSSRIFKARFCLFEQIPYWENNVSKEFLGEKLTIDWMVSKHAGTNVGL